MANFAKKLDLDNHVLNYRARLKSDFERKLRAKNFAKLYYLNKEYSKALRYLSEFMSVKNDCPAAYKLQGKIQEALNERDAAVQSFMKSLELDQSQSDLFDKIMDLIPYTNLEPDKVKLWTEKLQMAKKDSSFLDKTKICSPCSSPGNITLDILNNSINEPTTPASLKNLADLSLTGRSDDLNSTPRSSRFISPKALSPFTAKVNFEKIEKELIVLSQAQEGIVESVVKLQDQVAKSNEEVVALIKGLQKNFEKFNLSGPDNLSKDLTIIKETVIKHTEMMDKVMKSQVNLEDAVYELTESYGAETQGDGAVADNDNDDEEKSISNQPDYSSYNQPTRENFPKNQYSTVPSDQSAKVEPVFNPKSGVFSRLGQSPSSGISWPTPVNPSFPNPYIPISPPAAEQTLPANPSTQNTSLFSTPFPSFGSNVTPTFGAFPPISSQSIPQSAQPSQPGQSSPVKPAADPIADMWKSNPGERWECSGCYMRHAMSVKKCPCCETYQPGCSSPVKPSLFNFGIPQPESKPKDQPFSFSLPVKSSDTKTEYPSADVSVNQSILSATDSSINSSISSNRSDFSFSAGSSSFPQFSSGINTSLFNVSPFGNTTNENEANRQSANKPSIFGNIKAEPAKDAQSNVKVFGNTKEFPSFSFGGFNPDAISSNPSKSSTAAQNDELTDLEIVYVKEPKSDEAEKAKKYQLPINFYDYMNAKPCPGCRGCDEDASLDKTSVKTEPKAEPASNQEGSNLFAAAMSTFGTAQTNWDTGKASWSSITAPVPLFSKPNKGGDEEDNFATGEDAGGSENAVFKLPTIQMPDIVEVKTGEEEEEPMFVSRAKVFLFSDKEKEWKERGVGEFKLLKHPTNNTYRMLLRRDKVLKIACNQRITPSMKLEPLDNSESALTWAGVDFSEEPEKMGKFAIKFKNKELKNDFLGKFENIKSLLSSEEHSSEPAESSKAKPEPEPASKNDQPSKPSLFGSTYSQDSNTNLFQQAIDENKTAKSTWESTSSEWEMVMKPQPVFQRTETNENEIEGGEDAGGSENAVFKLPTIQMPDIVEVKTGEEEEEPMFVSELKFSCLVIKKKNGKERGVGEFKLLKHPTNNTYRMLLRRDKVLKIACNQRIIPSMKLEPLENSEAALTWAGVDFSEEPEKMGKFCIKFKNKELKNEFLNKVESIKSLLS
ncbi:E3 SUMO-protein ligase RanBP2 isoform X2 [Tetranychus urticae]|uniref:RanBD1 domain-containing protein n=1 Tax=Tetranychus urticae TaxID=32264 RepID=T1KP08_TETUR|nr:E3 SUMO-protein ligase RanBP2 isoform X2 [Tetranychus urticae]